MPIKLRAAYLFTTRFRFAGDFRIWRLASRLAAAGEPPTRRTVDESECKRGRREIPESFNSKAKAVIKVANIRSGREPW